MSAGWRKTGSHRRGATSSPRATVEGLCTLSQAVDIDKTKRKTDYHGAGGGHGIVSTSRPKQDATRSPTNRPRPGFHKATDSRCSPPAQGGVGWALAGSLAQHWRRTQRRDRVRRSDGRTRGSSGRRGLRRRWGRRPSSTPGLRTSLRPLTPEPDDVNGLVLHPSHTLRTLQGDQNWLETASFAFSGHVLSGLPSHHAEATSPHTVAPPGNCQGECCANQFHISGGGGGLKRCLATMKMWAALHRASPVPASAETRLIMCGVSGVISGGVRGSVRGDPRGRNISGGCTRGWPHAPAPAQPLSDHAGVWLLQDAEQSQSSHGPHVSLCK